MLHSVQVFLCILHAIGLVQSASMVGDPNALPLAPGSADLMSKHVVPEHNPSVEADRSEKGSSLTNRVLYKGPLPKLPSSTGNDHPLVAFHSPIKMYIPIRYTDMSSAESPGCVRCPKNLVVHRKKKAPILTPVPTLSICPGLARHPGRVHVAVVNGPRPGQRLSTGRHQVELVVWKANGPVHSCQYTITVRGRKSSTGSNQPPKRILLSCPTPISPYGGAVACDPSDGQDQRKLPNGSVCQFFCLPNFLRSANESGPSTAICNNGRWSPEVKISCEDVHCPIPITQDHGTWDCNPVSASTTPSKVGTICRIRCDSGYVVPTSQLGLDAILCMPPQWNSSGVAICERAYLPRLYHCHDRYVAITGKLKVTVSQELLPVGISHGDKPLTPVCWVKGAISAGKYRNDCEVTDTELRTQSNCSYVILVEERSMPQPHPDNCQNQTIQANDLETFSSKPVRFLVSVAGATFRTEILVAECDPSISEMGLGEHLIRCEVTDHQTNITGSCSFFITIQVEPPKLVSGCRDLMLTATSPLNITVPLPAFQILQTNETVAVSCSPTSVTTPGSVLVSCRTEAGDGACSFEMTILEEKTTTSQEPLTEQDEEGFSTFLTTKTKLLELVSGCQNLTLITRLPINLTVPLPLFQMTVTNETIPSSCSPSLVTALGPTLVSCSAVTNDAACSFEMNVLEEESTPAPEVSTKQEEESITSPELSTTEQEEESTPLPKLYTEQEEESTPPPELSTEQEEESTPLPELSTTEQEEESTPLPELSTEQEEESTPPPELTTEQEEESTPPSELSTEQEEQGTYPFPSTLSDCQNLSVPLHSSLECTETVEWCRLECDPGYGLLGRLDPLSVQCKDGVWDFQAVDNQTSLPECLAQLEGTAVEVWMGFQAIAHHCDEDLVDEIADQIQGHCPMGTRCGEASLNCTLDEESDVMMVTVNWTVQADFEPEEDYESEDEIPEAEIRLESALEEGRTLVYSQEELEVLPGLRILSDSFQRGLITLVCPDHFVPDMMAAKCVEDSSR